MFVPLMANVSRTILVSVKRDISDHGASTRFALDAILIHHRLFAPVTGLALHRTLVSALLATGDLIVRM